MNILICKRCDTEADLNKDPSSANGWQVVPTVICEACIEKEMAARPTHALVEERSQYRGKVISTFNLIQLQGGRQ